MSVATSQPTNPQADPNLPAKASPMVLAPPTDNGEFANLLDVAKFNHLQRVADLFSKSDLVPECYRNKLGNCFIATQMAIRLGVDPFMFMQNTYVVHGKPGMEAKLAIALVNTGGIFEDAIDYEIDGDDPKDQAYRVRAFAKRRSTGKVVYGPWIDWALVKGEKWDSKDGSKWRTMPGQMFLYRSATFFARAHCPERLMGMQTLDELYDVGAVRQVESTVVNRLPGEKTSSVADEVSARRSSQQPQQHTEELPSPTPSPARNSATTPPPSTATVATGGKDAQKPAPDAQQAPPDDGNQSQPEQEPEETAWDKRFQTAWLEGKETVKTLLGMRATEINDSLLPGVLKKGIEGYLEQHGMRRASFEELGKLIDADRFNFKLASDQK